MPGPPLRLRFTHAHRLHGRRAFAQVFDAKMRKSSGPLLVFTRPHGLPHHRLGLSVGRKVGNAVVRSRVKRMLREAFRLTRHDWPMLSGQALDLVVVVRPHEALALSVYQQHLADVVEQATRAWAKRRRNTATPSPSPPDESPR